MNRVSESGMALPHLGVAEEVEMAGMLNKSHGFSRGMSVPRGMPVVEGGTGSPSSYLWSSESCYGGSTPPGLLSDSSFAETESSEDDDFMAGLAEQMAHSMLDDSDDNTGSSGNEVDSVDRAGLWGETGWNPLQHHQLLGLNSPVAETEQLKHSSWSTGYWSSGYSSSSSKVSSPPSTPGAVDDGWEAFVGSDGGSFHADEKTIPGGYGSLGHLPEVQWRNNAFSEHRNGALPVLTKPYAAVVNPRRGTNLADDKRSPPPTQCRASKQPPAGVWNRQNRCHQQPQPQQHQQQQQHPCLPGARPGYRCGVAQRPLPPAWQPIPPANGSVMRAVFLGGSADRSSCGTGVFLPRSSNDYTKRKTSCSSVLLPSRIVQVLNLNVDDMRCHPSVQSGASYSENGTSVPANVEDGGGSFSCHPHPEEVWSSNSPWKTYTFCSQLHQPQSESTLPTEWSY